MSRYWVVDASPIILLAKAGRPELLSTCADRLLIPAAVAEEVRAAESDDPARSWVETAGSPFVAETQAVAPEIASWDLGRGESRVLSAAHRRDGWTAVVDDGAARRCAQALEIPVVGTLGVLVVARKVGTIEAVRPVVDHLVQPGLHVGKEVVERVLRMADEA